MFGCIANHLYSNKLFKFIIFFLYKSFDNPISISYSKPSINSVIKVVSFVIYFFNNILFFHHFIPLLSISVNIKLVKYLLYSCILYHSFGPNIYGGATSYHFFINNHRILLFESLFPSSLRYIFC